MNGRCNNIDNNSQEDSKVRECSEFAALHQQLDVRSAPSSPSDRSRQPKRSMTTLLAIVLAMKVSLSIPGTSAFAPRAQQSRLSIASLQARKSAVEAVKPRSHISQEARKKAVQAMENTKESSTLDEHLLDMLSGEYLYPKSTRPRGRPAMVPAAMSMETMKKYREQKDSLQQSAERAKSDAIRVETIPPVRKEAKRRRHQASLVKEVKPVVQSTTQKKKRRGRPKKQKAATAEAQQLPPRKRATRGVRGSNGDESSPNALAPTASLPTRKRVKKDLPERRYKEGTTNGIMEQQTRNSSPISNLQKYYRTELLTAKEEYTLGMKVNFLVKCEQVHEGLAIDLERTPTIEEWARACG